MIRELSQETRGEVYGDLGQNMLNEPLYEGRYLTDQGEISGWTPTGEIDLFGLAKFKVPEGTGNIMDALTLLLAGGPSAAKGVTGKAAGMGNVMDAITFTKQAKPVTTIGDKLRKKYYNQFVGSKIGNFILSGGKTRMVSRTPKTDKGVSAISVSEMVPIDWKIFAKSKDKVFGPIVKKTAFGRLVERQTKRRYLKRLSTEDEYKRFVRTYPEKASEMSFGDYKQFLKQRLDPGIGPSKTIPIHQKPINWDIEGMLKEKGGMLGGRFVGEKIETKIRRLAKSDPKRAKSMEKAWADSGLKKGSYIDVDPFIQGSGRFRSTLRHELSHQFDFDLDQLPLYGRDLATASKDYMVLGEGFKQGVKTEIKLHLALKGGKKGIVDGVVKDISKLPKRMQYLLRPTETLARLKQIRHGKDKLALSDLQEIYTDDFIKKLMKEYWSVAPAGIGVDEIMGYFRESEQMMGLE